MVEWGDQVPKLLKMQEESDGHFQAPALQNIPPLTLVQDFYYSQFQQLSLDRRYTDVGPLPISTKEIRDYWELFVKLDFYGFYEYIRLIDRIYLDEVTERRKTREQQARKMKPPPSKGPGRR